MKHVVAIKELIRQGQIEEAESALEGLLSLGPQNLEALKLKAQIFGAEGRFHEEDRVWLQIMKIHQEDEDALHYFHRRHVEDREHYYFTDELPGGGRRFLADPRSIVQYSLYGLGGCLSFLLLARLSDRVIFLQEPWILIAAFAVLVLGPWVAIGRAYILSLRCFDVSSRGIGLVSWFKTWALDWQAIDKMCLSFGPYPFDPDLRLVVIPKDPEAEVLEIAFNPDLTPIRARSHLTAEIGIYYGSLRPQPRANLGLEGRKIKKFG